MNATAGLAEHQPFSVSVVSGCTWAFQLVWLCTCFFWVWMHIGLHFWVK